MANQPNGCFLGSHSTGFEVANVTFAPTPSRLQNTDYWNQLIVDRAEWAGITLFGVTGGWALFLKQHQGYRAYNSGDPASQFDYKGAWGGSFLSAELSSTGFGLVGGAFQIIFLTLEYVHNSADFESNFNSRSGGSIGAPTDSMKLKSHIDMEGLQDMGKNRVQYLGSFESPYWRYDLDLTANMAADSYDFRVVDNIPQATGDTNSGQNIGNVAYVDAPGEIYKQYAVGGGAQYKYDPASDHAKGKLTFKADRTITSATGGKSIDYATLFDMGVGTNIQKAPSSWQTVSYALYERSSVTP
jgi:hypothetical protein